MYLEMGQGQGTSGCADCAVLPLSVHSPVVWGQGVCSEESRLQACQHQIRRQRIWWLTGVVCLGVGGARLGVAWWWWGPVSSSCPFALSPSYPPQSRASAPQRHQWSLGGGRRQEAGTRGWSGGRRRRRREGELEAGRARGPTDAGCAGAAAWDSAFFCLRVGAVSSRVLFAGPGRGLSSGPTEDDVDLSVLHALGRSGRFS